MKTYMPLDGFRWSCDSDSAICDIPQTDVLGRAGGLEMELYNVQAYSGLIYSQNSLYFIFNG